MQYHDENNLDVINQKITEIKKKIQLSGITYYIYLYINNYNGLKFFFFNLF